jgi:hypothetical protein
MIFGATTFLLLSAPKIHYIDLGASHTPAVIYPLAIDMHALLY